MRKKINIILPDEPSNYGKGYQILAHHRCEKLKQRDDIIVHCVKPVKQFRSKQIRNQSLECITVVYEIGLLEISSNFFSHLVKWKTFLTVFYTSKMLKKNLKNSFAELNICYLSRAFRNVEGLEKSTVVEFVDSMERNFTSRASASNSLKTIFYNLEAWLSARFERKIANEVLASTCVSRIDANYISKNVHRMPIGIESDASLLEVEKEYSICFSGKMDYQPNIDAVIWFYNNVWCKVRDSKPELLFKILGAKPSHEIKTLAEIDSSVLVTGYVECLKEELGKSLISVAPMRIGSGMQFKILEAMNCGVPVVTNSYGLGDIAAEPNHEVVLCTDANDYVSAILKLLENDEKRNYIGYRAKKFVQREHSWAQLNNDFVGLLDNLK